MADTNRVMSMKCVILGNQNARRISAAKIPTRKRVSDIGCPGFLSGLTASHSGLTTERPTQRVMLRPASLTTAQPGVIAQWLLMQISHVEPSPRLLRLSRLRLLRGWRAAQ